MDTGQAAATLATRDKDIGCALRFLSNDLQSKGENDGGNCHIFKYGAVILAYILLKPKQPICGLLNMHCYSCSNY